jgi:hypothetical protein
MPKNAKHIINEHDIIGRLEKDLHLNRSWVEFSIFFSKVKHPVSFSTIGLTDTVEKDSF